MKRTLLILFCLILLVGCSSNQQSAKPKNGVITIPYEKPVDFKYFEVFISLTPNFKPTGWDGSKWISQPNSPSEWNGADKTLFMVTTNDPIQVTGLTPGKTYYVQVVVVDTSNQRSIPSPEIEAVAGDAQRSSTLVVAASDSSPASKAGADYICDGINDSTVILEAISSLSGSGGLIKLSEGTFSINANLIPVSSLVVEGSGPSTILKIQNGASDVSVFYSVRQNSPYLIAYENIQIKNLTIDGNMNRVTGGNGIVFRRLRYLKLENIYIKNCNAYGVIIEDCQDVDIEALNVDSCGEDGIYFSRHLANLPLRLGIKISNSTFFSCKNGIYVATKGVKINNCESYQNLRNGIYVSPNGDETEINNCNVHTNSQENNNVFSNIYVCASDVTVNGTTCKKGVLTNAPAYGILIGLSTATGNAVTNCICYQSGVTGGIYSTSPYSSFGMNRNNDGTWSTTPN